MVYTIRLNKLEYRATPAAWNELQALAYWISERSYCLERYGETPDGTGRAHRTITECIFPQLDRLRVPFWVQNRVIAWAEDWRNTRSELLYQAFERPGYSIIAKTEREVKIA